MAPRQITCQIDLVRKAIGFSINGGPLGEASGLNLPPALRIWAAFSNKDDALRLVNYRRSTSMDDHVQSMQMWFSETDLRAKEAREAEQAEAAETMMRAKLRARAESQRSIAETQLAREVSKAWCMANVDEPSSWEGLSSRASHPAIHHVGQGHGAHRVHQSREYLVTSREQKSRDMLTRQPNQVVQVIGGRASSPRRAYRDV